jgi:choline dehydrogenase
VNYFSVGYDLQVQTAGARLVRRLFNTKPLAGLSRGETVPGTGRVPNNGDNGSDANWASWIKQAFFPVAHPIGTCSMMRRDLGGQLPLRLLKDGDGR